jgi:transcriptional regulator with XRE-family HTH domain
MGRLEYGQLVKRERQRRGLSLAKLGFRIGELPDGTYLDGSAVRLLESGGRAIENDPDLYDRVNTVLSIDRDEADVALGRLPEGIDLDDIRELRAASERRATRVTAAGRVASRVEGAPAAASSISDPEDLMRSCAPFAGQGARKAA